MLLWLLGYALDDCRRRLIPSYNRELGVALVVVLVVFAVKLPPCPSFPATPTTYTPGNDGR